MATTDAKDKIGTKKPLVFKLVKQLDSRINYDKTYDAMHQAASTHDWPLVLTILQMMHIIAQEDAAKRRARSAADDPQSAMAHLYDFRGDGNIVYQRPATKGNFVPNKGNKGRRHYHAPPTGNKGKRCYHAQHAQALGRVFLSPHLQHLQQNRRSPGLSFQIPARSIAAASGICTL